MMKEVYCIVCAKPFEVDEGLLLEIARAKKKYGAALAEGVFLCPRCQGAEGLRIAVNKAKAQ